MNNDLIIGIDLGTTNSCAAIYPEKIIPAQNGDRTIPSVIGFPDSNDENKILVGKDAIKDNNFKKIPLLYDSKRFIGRNFNDPEVKEEGKYLSYKLVEDESNSKVKLCCQIGNKTKEFYPEEVSAEILKQIKLNAEKFLKIKVNRAVITVPAYFNNSQRESTKKAAEIAGLKVIRIINEPTATAIGYLYDIQNDLERSMKKNKEMNEFEKERIILVFDLGGGTFDVSIVKVKNKNFEILASCGDDHLGGQDFTERLTDYVIECFKSDEDIDENINFKDKNNRDLFKSYLKLKKKIEDYKTQLSFQNAVDIVYEDNL